MFDKAKALATGIGSLPHKNADEALDLIFKYCPRIPFWPQLPKKDIREGMVAQFSEHLPGIRISKDGVSFNAQEGEKDLELFYERVIAGDLGYFKISPDFASGLYKFYERLERQGAKDIESIKCHVTGPFTFAASINDEKGAALLHDKVFLQAMIKGLSMKALWQISFFKEFNKKIIVFIDEPYLGCFGSAYTPLNKEEVVSGLTELTGQLKAEGALAGVHCCGNTDWSIFTDIESVDIISFDAFSFLERVVLYADNLKGFFKRGGIICWGIVPTQEFKGTETADLLVGKINAGIEALAKKGVERNLLRRNLLISPACGLGALDTGKADKIFRALSQVENKLFDNLF